MGKFVITICLVLFPAIAYAALAGSLSTSTYDIDGVTYTGIFYSLDGQQYLIADATSLADAKTAVNAVISAQESYLNSVDSGYGAIATALGGAPDSTDTVDGVLYNVYVVSGKTYYVPAGSESEVISGLSKQKSNLANAVTFWKTDVKNALSGL